MSEKLGFRKDINGLRGWAVLAVVLFHFGVPGIHAGFIGVDVFFVISGFLMTAIILQGSGFRVLSFYWSRFKRIVPALWFLCAVLLVLSWFFMPSADFAMLGKHVFASLLFVSNMIFWREAGYFDVTSHEKWLLHTWSLSVEWQFYILYPLLIVALVRFLSPRWLFRALVVCTLLSFFFCLWLSKTQTVAAFYSLPSRAWEMTLGGLVFLLMRDIELRRSLGRYLEWFGFSLMAGALVFVDGGSTWPGSEALFPTLGAACVLAAARQDSVLTRGWVMQWLGLRSYSLYLWHWPIVVGGVFLDIEPSVISIMLGIVLALLLAEISYRLVEGPSRRLFTTARPVTVVPALVGVAAVAVIGLGLKLTGGAGWRLPASITAITEVPFDHSVHRDGSCFLRPEQGADTFSTCDDGNGNYSLVLWGDSHAAHLYPGLMEAKSKDERIVQRTANSCPPIIGKPIASRPNCQAMNDAVMAAIVKNPPRTVLLAANWVNHDWRAVAVTLQALKAAGVERIGLVGPVPQWRGSLPSYLEKQNLLFKKTEFPARVAKGTRPEISELDGQMRRFAEAQNVQYISPIAIFCESGACLAFVDAGNAKQSLTAWDYSHLTVDGSRYLVSRFPTGYR